MTLTPFRVQHSSFLGAWLPCGICLPMPIRTCALSWRNQHALPWHPRWRKGGEGHFPFGTPIVGWMITPRLTARIWKCPHLIDGPRERERKSSSLLRKMTSCVMAPADPIEGNESKPIATGEAGLLVSESWEKRMGAVLMIRQPDPREKSPSD